MIHLYPLYHDFPRDPESGHRLACRQHSESEYTLYEQLPNQTVNHYLVTYNDDEEIELLLTAIYDQKTRKQEKVWKRL